MVAYSEINTMDNKIELAEDNIKIEEPKEKILPNPNINYPMNLELGNTVHKKTPFWLESPNIILHSLDMFPSADMSYTEKLNAISRMVIVLTCILYYTIREYRVLVIGAITIGTIYFVYNYYETSENKFHKNLQIQEENEDLEGFRSPAADSLAKQNIEIPKDVFSSPNSSNPFSNVLISDYESNPAKKPAPPSYNETVNDGILEQAKKVVRELNPDITDKLFHSLGDEFMFEQSLRPFYTTANSTIPNDQAAFAEFCYGSMISCKEGNQFACARNLARYQT